MAIPEEQREIAAYLTELAGNKPSETHISAVFLGDDAVWKLKKAVRLSFLDFSALAAREHYARRELALNQAAAPGLYRDVVPVVRRPDGGLALDAPGEPVDWVLRMARIPATDFFPRIVAEGRLTTAMLDALGDAVAAYHESLPPPAAPVDSVAGLRRTIDGNATAAHAAGLDPRQVEDWTRQAHEALARSAPRLAARDGRVRRAHGDLHLGNLCLWQGRPVAFDALEFDEDLATIDLGYDLAFLLMDLDRQAGRAAANRVMNRYVDRTGDVGLVGPLPLFLSIRAMVRAHVAAASGADGAAYLAAARAALTPAAPCLVAIGGLPGTGKSTLARDVAPGLGPAPGALILRSDTIRKRLHGVAPEERLPPKAYTEAATERVMASLIAAAHLAGETHAVIADATFLDPVHRLRIGAAALGFVGIWLQAPRAELAARVAARTGDASDATPDVLARMQDPGPEVWRSGAWHRVDAADRAAAARRIGALVSMRNQDASC